MSAQEYSAPSQTEERMNAFLEGKSIDLSSEQSLKSVHHPILTRENNEHPGNFQNKSVNSAFNRVSWYILSLAKPEGCKKRSHIVRLPLRALGCHKR